MKSSAVRVLSELKDFDQDLEWYPTTNEIISAFHDHANKRKPGSLLDVGAGDGKVLKSFKEANKRNAVDYGTEYFAIEKARPLLDRLPVDISILGTDFWEQSLLDKDIDCIFSNPPYKQFVEWAAKIIREANSNYIYLVIPQRWKDQQSILNAIKSRQATATVIGEFDFLNSEDRQARAKVDLLFISLCNDAATISRLWRRNGKADPEVDPFNLWIKEFFNLDAVKDKHGLADYEKERDRKDERAKKRSNALVSGRGLIEVLDELYRDELEGLIQNYQKVCSLDAELFKELDISVKSIISSIKSRINGLKNAYWNELFNNYEPLTGRLTSASRTAFIKTIRAKTNIDFTASNAYAITAWAIKNADQYLDKQMIETFEAMTDAANVINYKSNEKVFAKNRYRYSFSDDKHTHFKLDYRIVTERKGGLSKPGSSGHYESRGGLVSSAADFIDDLLVVAKNLGFVAQDEEYTRYHNFAAGGKEEFRCVNKSGEEVVLMTVRAYINGNLHIKFNQSFMLALNVEVGRLMGWIHNAQQAAEEINASEKEAGECFNTAYSLRKDGGIAGLLGVVVDPSLS